MENTRGHYYKVTKDRPRSDILVRALTLVDKRDMALDLGSGALRDSRYLIQEGFTVTSVDVNPEVKMFAEEIWGINDKRDKLILALVPFDEFEFPANTYDIINAQFALPFNKTETFDVMFSRLKDSLKVGGVFVGQFFGVNDEWSSNEIGNTMTFHTSKQIETLLGGMKIIEIITEEKDAKTAVGKMKHWHIFHVISQKL